MSLPPGSPPPGGTPDPSMEDILASIRRILSEDEAPSPAHPPPHAPDAEAEVLDLPTSMLVQEPHDPGPPPHPADLPMPAARPPAMREAEPPSAVPAVSLAERLDRASPDGRTLMPHADEPTAAPPRPAAAPATQAGPEPQIAAVPQAPPETPASRDPLLAPEAAALVTATVGGLMRHLAQERNSAIHRGGPTIEDLVREEIRPLLKAWLDTHLPTVVQALVRTEIERVVGRAIG